MPKLGSYTHFKSLEFVCSVRRHPANERLAPISVAISVPISVAALLCLAASLPASAASIAPLGAPNGMVVTAQHLATKVGVDVLKKGGNAIDVAGWRRTFRRYRAATSGSRTTRISIMVSMNSPFRATLRTH